MRGLTREKRMVLQKAWSNPRKTAGVANAAGAPRKKQAKAPGNIQSPQGATTSWPPSLPQNWKRGRDGMQRLLTPHAIPGTLPPSPHMSLATASHPRLHPPLQRFLRNPRAASTYPLARGFSCTKSQAPRNRNYFSSNY